MRSGYDCGGHWYGFGIWFEILEMGVIMVVSASFGLAVGLGFGALG